MTAIEFNQQLINQRAPLNSFAYSLTLNREDAKDLLQDTYLKAISYRDKFVDATNLKAWLYTIMKNTFINNYRRNNKKKQILAEATDANMLKQTFSVSHTNAESDINLKQIKAAVNALDDDYKIPFQRYFDGFKYKEIADEMNLPIGTVKSRIFLARKQLMQTLKEYN